MIDFIHAPIVIVTIINSVLVSASVLVHYEVLNHLALWIHGRNKQRRSILLLVFGALTAHVIEVWLFGLAFFVLIHYGNLGSLDGNFNGTVLDCVYFSIVSYTSLGYGDIQPHGALRFVASFEALTGLVLMAWTISFLFNEHREAEG